MLITGNRILDALDFLKERAKVLDTQFTAGLFRFEDEDEQRDPREVIAEYQTVQRKIARLQEVQAAYNLQVEVQVSSERMSLQQVLHLVGSANRVKALWAQASTSENQSPYYANYQRTRDKEQEYARRVVPLEQAREQAEQASRLALAFKQAIRSGNAQSIEMNVEADLFM